MINLFVTYRCNLACEYCFASGLRREFRDDMTDHDFSRLLDWIRSAQVTSAALIGGEPTLHPAIVQMAEQLVAAGVQVVLFTNGLFPSELIPALTPSISNFVVNYNDPDGYPASLKTTLENNLSSLADHGARLTFSKNFMSTETPYAYLIEGAKKYGVKTVRYDLSRPNNTGDNTYFNISDSKALMKHMVGFVRECEANDIATGLDCCLKFCDLTEEDRAFLERVSIKLRGICHPSIDIHPDLSASYCLPMRDVSVPDVTAFSSSERLMHHFASAVRSVRFENVDEKCLGCHDFRRSCQGGCLAMKQIDFPAAGVSSSRKAANN